MHAQLGTLPRLGFAKEPTGTLMIRRNYLPLVRVDAHLDNAAQRILFAFAFGDLGNESGSLGFLIDAATGDLVLTWQSRPISTGEATEILLRPLLIQSVS